jgi:hypothetical protein
MIGQRAPTTFNTLFDNTRTHLGQQQASQRRRRRRFALSFQRLPKTKTKKKPRIRHQSNGKAEQARTDLAHKTQVAQIDAVTMELLDETIGRQRQFDRCAALVDAMQRRRVGIGQRLGQRRHSSTLVASV